MFKVKSANNQYTLYKVAEIKGDSALLSINKFETNLRSGLSYLVSIGDTSYSKQVYAFAKKDLKSMLDKGEIIDIDRK